MSKTKLLEDILGKRREKFFHDLWRTGNKKLIIQDIDYKVFTQYIQYTFLALSGAQGINNQVQVCLELSILIILAQDSLRSLLYVGISHVSLIAVLPY